MNQDQVKEAVLTQGLGVAGGAVAGAIAKHTVTPPPGGRTPKLAIQVGSAMGAAARNGAGVQGTIAAGTAVVAANVAGVAAATTAAVTVAAPFIIGAAVIGGTIWGACKLIEYLDE